MVLLGEGMPTAMAKSLVPWMGLMHVLLRCFSVVVLLAATASMASAQLPRFYFGGTLGTSELSFSGTNEFFFDEFEFGDEFDEPFLNDEFGETMEQRASDDLTTGSFLFGLEQPIGQFEVRCESQFLFSEDVSLFGGEESFGPPLVLEDRCAWYGNLWLDRSIAENFQVYAGGGLGASSFDVASEFGGSTVEETAFAWQYGVGFIVVVAPRCEIDFGYRRLDLGDFSITEVSEFGNEGSETSIVSGQQSADQFSVTLRVFTR